MNIKHNPLVVILMALFSTFLLSVHPKIHTFFVGHYWFDHWLLNYSCGFVRRGLCGSILSALGGWQHNIIVVNLFAFIIPLLILGLLIRKLLDLFPVNNPVSFFLILFLVLSPLVSLFFECLGDPLQLTLLTTFLLIHLTIQHKVSLFWKFVLFSGVMGMNLFIHEASLFINGPAFFLILWGAPGENAASKKNIFFKAMLAFCYGLILLVAVLFIEGHGKISGNKKERLLQQMYSQSRIFQKSYQTSPNTAVLLSIGRECKKYSYFGQNGPRIVSRDNFERKLPDGEEIFKRLSQKGYLEKISARESSFVKIESGLVKEYPGRRPQIMEAFERSSRNDLVSLGVIFLSATAVPLLFFNIFFWACRYRHASGYENLWKIFVGCSIFSLLLSLPLYIVATDWGRFSVYTLCLNLYLACRIFGSTLSVGSNQETKADKPLFLKEEAWGEKEKVLCLLVILLMISPIHSKYRISGLTLKSFLCFLIAGMPILFLINSRDKRKARDDA